MAGSVSPQGSFHLCPDFNITPPPLGHLRLGSVLRRLDIQGLLSPLDAGATVPIPEDHLWPSDKPHEKAGFSRTLRDLRSLDASIWAKIFGWDGLGAAFAFLRRRDNDETLTVDKVLVRYFTPTMAYTTRALEVDSVAFYVRNTKQKKPVYLVTGLMWVEGARLSKLRQSKTTAGGQAAATDPHSGTTGGAGGSYEREKSLATSFDGSTPFVLGYRVRKIWWDKAGARQEELDVVGAALGAGGGGGAGAATDNLLYTDDDEVSSASGQTIVVEPQVGQDEAVTWILP